nr:hypothetical protein [uncultured Flavobacterium sp.]
MKILLIRRDSSSGIEIKNALQHPSFTLYDVYRNEQIRIAEINSKLTCEVFFFNIPISEFDRIYFLNTPSVMLPGDTSTSNKGNTFEYCEMDASIVSALQYYPDKLINAGTVNMSLGIKNRYFLTFLFKSIGWKLHASLFNLTQVIPDKAEYQFNMIVTCRNHSFYPYNEMYAKSYNNVSELIFKTQKAMWERQIDILNVTCVVFEDTFFIVGVSEHFLNINHEILSKFLKEII